VTHGHSDGTTRLHDNNWGCGASGPDASWPRPPNNDNTREVGFDTRLPWASASVVPSTFPDVMSYCQSSGTPTKWIAPYRWQNLFSAFAPPALSSDALRAQVQANPQNYYYITGRLNRDGTGKLDPVLVQPGIATEDASPGDYAIELQDANGGVIGKPLSFTASFIDVEGDLRDTVFFNFQIPEQPGVAKIVLKKGSQVLDTITQSSHPPTVSVTAPNGGETWSGTQMITWNASDPDGDSLSFTILYSPDDGATWYPIASDVHGNSYQVDTATLSGGSAGKIRVIATDGLNNAQDDSDATFTVAGKAPSVSIQTPQTQAQLSADQPITFQGDATDPEDSAIPDASFVWSYVPAGVPGASPTTFGSGRQVSTTLPPGSYEVTLTVVDSDGNAGTSKITIMVGGGRLFLPLIQR
jgi:hypothetical protein